MAREYRERPPEVIEDIIKQSLKILNSKLNKGQIKLLLRLIMSGIANHFFHNPDDLIDVGFLRLEKSPEKSELFKVTLLKDPNSEVVNAETLWEFYTGELQRRKQLKEVVNGFLGELIKYSKAQEIDITKLTNDIDAKREGETNHGI